MLKRHCVLIICVLIFTCGIANATDTLDCSNDTYFVRLAVGSTGYFGEVTVYEGDKEHYYPRSELKAAHLNWDKKELDLESNRDTVDMPKIIVKARGDKGLLVIHKKQFAITCDWTS